MHEDNVSRALEDLARRLREIQVPFTLLGARAMRFYGYVRHTEDIDILTTREGLDLIHEKLVGLGISPRGKGLRKALRDTVHKVDIDVIQAGETAGSKESGLVFPDPRSDDFIESQGIRIPRLEKLIEFKLVSGIWGHRLKDFGDVAELIKANRLDESLAGRLIPTVRAKYIEILEETRREVRTEE